MERALKVCLVLAAVMSMAASAGTVAYWNFEDGVAGQAFTPADQPGGSGGSMSTEGNNYLMRGWNPQYGPSFTDTTARGTGLAMRNVNQDGYCLDDGLRNWTPTQFTLEATFMLNNVSGWKTMIARRSAASSTGGSFSALYFQKTTTDNYFRFDFATAGGERFDVSSASSGLKVEAGKWYSMAVTSDGSLLSLYVNDIAAGNGWQLAGSRDISAAVNSAMSAAAGDWLFGVGWYGNNIVDKIDGYMDDVRFSDTALAPSQFIPEPATLVLLGLGALVSLRKRN
jgi:hypothetical protein